MTKSWKNQYIVSLKIMYSSINSRSTFFLKAFSLYAYFSLSRAFLTMIMPSTCFWVLYDPRTWQSAIVVACEWHARAVRLARSRRILQIPAEFLFCRFRKEMIRCILLSSCSPCSVFLWWICLRIVLHRFECSEKLQNERMHFVLK